MRGIGERVVYQLGKRHEPHVEIALGLTLAEPVFVDCQHLFEARYDNHVGLGIRHIPLEQSFI